MFSYGACYVREGECEQFGNNEYGCRSSAFIHKEKKSFDFSFFLFFFYFFKECFFGSDKKCYNEEEECSIYKPDACIVAPQGILLLIIIVPIIFVLF
jgi:hypothetical protein